MHFLVTGGAGFIGSHLVEQLLSSGYRVTIVDNLSTGKEQNLPTHPHLTLIKKNILECAASDLRASHASTQALAARYDGLAHLAGTPSVAHSWTSPLPAHDNTLSGTVAAIELCQQLNIPRIVFASSAAVYGDLLSHRPDSPSEDGPCHRSQILISENAPARPLSPYGLQKLASEQYISLFAKHLGLSAVNLRLFNVFGPRQDPSSPYSGVISIFAKAMQEGRPVVINGAGQQTRDFIYVKDVALMFAKALTQPLASGTALTCNVGTGKAMSILELKEALQSCFPEWRAGTTFVPARPGDIQDSQADISRAQLYLNFEPRFSMQTGLLALKESLSGRLSRAEKQRSHNTSADRAAKMPVELAVK